MAALMVICCHSPFKEKIPVIPIIFSGEFAVSIFFCISGYLIIGSFLYSSGERYLRKRALRIMPALVVVNLIVAFIMGPLVSTLSIRDYFLNSSPYIYFIGTSLFFLTGRGIIRGVFEKNAIKSPNGSLWTLFFEVACYFFVWILGKFNMLKTRVLLIFLVILVLLTEFNFKLTFPYTFRFNITYTQLFMCFISGMIVYLHKDKIIDFIKNPILSYPILGILILIYAVGCFANWSYLFLLPSVVYMTFFFAFCKIDLSKFGSKYDLSYGVYIYAFPIQQILNQYFHHMGIFSVIIVMLLSLACAFLSYNLVEKPFLNKKRTNYRFSDKFFNEKNRNF